MTAPLTRESPSDDGRVRASLTLPETVAVVHACGLGLALAACATTSTPEQNLAYERWARCSSPYVQLQRVGLDGRISFMFSNPAARQEILQCLADAGRGGPPLPEAVGVRPPGGP
jgi:hypothetical protein